MFFLGLRWCPPSPQVLYLLRFHRGPRDVLLSSVHVGGDVDSVAALALATVAALEGCQWGTPRGLPWKLLEEPGVLEERYSVFRGDPITRRVGLEMFRVCKEKKDIFRLCNQPNQWLTKDFSSANQQKWGFKPTIMRIEWDAGSWFPLWVDLPQPFFSGIQRVELVLGKVLDE